MFLFTKAAGGTVSSGGAHKETHAVVVTATAVSFRGLRIGFKPRLNVCIGSGNCAHWGSNQML